MNASKSFGSYSAPVTILKIIRDYISEPLAFLVHDSLSSGNFPNKLKSARITPIFKKGSKFDKDNYWPIFVLSNFSKIIEKAMYHRLYGYLEELKVLYPLLFGFRGNLQLCMLLSQSLILFASPLMIMNLFVVYLLI